MILSEDVMQKLSGYEEILSNPKNVILSTPKAVLLSIYEEVSGKKYCSRCGNKWIERLSIWYFETKGTVG